MNGFGDVFLYLAAWFIDLVMSAMLVCALSFGLFYCFGLEFTIMKGLGIWFGSQIFEFVIERAVSNIIASNDDKEEKKEEGNE